MIPSRRATVCRLAAATAILVSGGWAIGHPLGDQAGNAVRPTSMTPSPATDTGHLPPGADHGIRSRDPAPDMGSTMAPQH